MGKSRKSGEAVGGARSQKQLAAALSVSRQTVGEYVRREDWPVAREPPWGADQIERIRAWQKGLQEDRSQMLNDPTIRSVTRQLKLEQAKL